MTTTKAETRRLVLKKVAAMTPDERKTRGTAAISRLLALEEYKTAKAVMLYYGVGLELDTRPLISAAIRDGKVVALPKITGPGMMDARRIRNLSELVPGPFGIPEPGELCERVGPDCLDFILVPGVAFSPDGGRLGRGGGYYDRYLPPCAGLKAALAYSIQLLPELPTEAHDIKVDILITDQ